MEQRSEEWHEFRKDKIGASEAAVILGISPYMTPYQLYMNKKGLFHVHESPAMTKGREYEEAAIKMYEALKDISTFPSVRTHGEYPWMMASFDGLSFTGTQAVEVKFNNKKNHDLAESGVVPDHHYPQLQHQMAVGGLQEVDYFSYNGIEGHLVTIKRDDQYIEDLIQKEKIFIENLLADIPPNFSDKDKEDISQDIRWKELENELEEVKRIQEDTKIEEDKIRKEMEELSQGRSVVGNKFMLTYSFSKGRVNYSSIPELKSINLDLYRGEGRKIVTIREIKKVRD